MYIVMISVNYRWAIGPTFDSRSAARKHARLENWDNGHVQTLALKNENKMEIEV